MRFPGLANLREHTGDPMVDRMQENRDKVAAFLSAMPWLQGRMLTGDDVTVDAYDLAFTSGTARELAHGLGRACRGFMVVDAKTASPTLVRGTVTTGLEDTHIKLTSGATCTVKVWVW